jgi:hypothetical protein
LRMKRVVESAPMRCVFTMEMRPWIRGGYQLGSDAL